MLITRRESSGVHVVHDPCAWADDATSNNTPLAEPIKNLRIRTSKRISVALTRSRPQLRDHTSMPTSRHRPHNDAIWAESMRFALQYPDVTHTGSASARTGS